MEWRLSAQWAALDRLRDEIYLMPADDQAESTRRAGNAAFMLISVWMARLLGLDGEWMIRAGRVAAGVSIETLQADPARAEAIDAQAETLLAQSGRGIRLCWDATAPGMPLSPDRFVLAGDGPWASAIRQAVLLHIGELQDDEDDDPDDPDRAVAFFISLLLPPEHQVRYRNDPR